MTTSSAHDAQAVARRIHSLIDAGATDAALEQAGVAVDRAIGDEPKAILQHVLAIALNAAGRPVDALRAAAASRDGSRRARSRIGECDALLAIGSVLRAAGDHAAAIETLEEAEVIARELDDGPRIGVVLRQIGICCSLIGRHQQALSNLGEAAELHAVVPEHRDHLNTRLSLHNALSRRATALPADSEERRMVLEALLQKGQDLAADAALHGATRIELMALGNRAISLHDVGRHREAFDALAALLPRYREHAMVPNEAICLFEMGRALESLGDVGAARRHYADAVGRFDRNGSGGDLRDALVRLADVEEAMGDHRDALATLRRVRAIETELNESEAHRNASQRELRIELARLSSQWLRLASIDPLTGLANRRGLEQWFATTRPRVERGESVMVLLHDLDHFKSINDRFGHPVGDDVLRQVAKLIDANCRSADLAVRYGGEEFILALLGVDRDGAIDIAERLRASVEAHDWRAIAPDLSVTVSVGLAGAAETPDATALLTLADRRLYAAKHDGRNRVVHSG